MILRLASTLILAAGLAVTALAHTSLKASVPASGTIVTSSPKSVTLEFVKPVRLTLVRVESVGGNDRKLDFSPGEVSAKFETDAPELSPGRNAIHWTALSPDGHVIDGTIILVLRPENSSRSSPEPTEALAKTAY